MWSDTEVERLQEMYDTTPNSVIAEELGRTKPAVATKAHNLGLSKDRTAARNYETKNKSAEYPTDSESFANYICGFVDGEGSFNITETRGTERFRFAIEVVEDDEEIINDIRSFFGVGTVYYADAQYDSWQDKVAYVVYDTDSLARTIIPFFRHYGLRAPKKREQFESFAEQFHNHHGIEPKGLYQ